MYIAVASDAAMMQKPENLPPTFGAFRCKIPSSTKYIIAHRKVIVNCNFVFFSKTNDFLRWKRKMLPLPIFLLIFS